MSLSVVRRIFGLEMPSRRPVTASRVTRRQLRCESLEDRTVPTSTPCMFSYTPDVPVSGHTFHLLVKVLDNQNNVVTDYTGTVAIQADAAHGGTRATHHFSAGEHGVFNFALSLTCQGTFEQVLISIADTETGAHENDLIPIKASGGGGGGGGDPPTFDLSLDSVEVPTDQAIVPGNKVKALLHVSNSGNHAYSAAPTISALINGVTFDSVKKSIFIGALSDAVIPVTFKVPDLDPSQAGATYGGGGGAQGGPSTVSVEVSVSAVANETSTSDNDVFVPVDFENKFGVVNNKHVALKVKSGAKEIIFKLNGPGYGELVPVSAGVVDLFFYGTTDATNVTITGAAGVLRNILTVTPLNSVTMPNIDVTGYANFFGGLGTLTVHDFGGDAGSKLTISKHFDNGTDMYFARLHDTSILANGGIGTFATGEWKNTDATADVLTAPFIKNLTAGPAKLKRGAPLGYFQADLALAGPGLDERPALGKATVHANARGTWNVASAGEVDMADAVEWHLVSTGRVEKVNINGVFRNSPGSGAALEADSFGTIHIEGDLSVPEILVDDAADNGVAIDRLEIHNVEKLDDLAALQGGIKHLETDEDWNTSANTHINTQWIGDIEGGQDKDFVPELVNLTGVDPSSKEGQISLGKIHVEGKVGGDWNVFANVVNWHAQTALADWVFTGGVGANSPGTFIAQLKIDLSMLGSITTGGINDVAIGLLAGSLETTATVPIHRIELFAAGLATLKTAGQVETLLVHVGAEQTTFNLLGGVGTFTADRLSNSTVVSPFIGNFIVRGANVDEGKPAFDQTSVSAGTIGNVLLVNVEGDPTENAYGIFADSILGYRRYDDHKLVKHLVLQNVPGIVDQEGSFRVQINN